MNRSWQLYIHDYSWKMSSVYNCSNVCVCVCVCVQGYRQKDSYMACQGPLQHTIEDFWRMIWEWRSCSIVMLTELEERGQVSSPAFFLFVCNICKYANSANKGVFFKV